MTQDMVVRALRRVLPGAVVDHLRPDSPLTGERAAVALAPTDAVALVDAIAEEAEREGARCRLGDADLAQDPLTLGGLVSSAHSRWETSVVEGRDE